MSDWSHAHYPDDPEAELLEQAEAELHAATLAAFREMLNAQEPEDVEEFRFGDESR